ISGLEDEYRLAAAAGKPMLLYLKSPAPGLEPQLAAMIDAIRTAGAASYRLFATPRALERLLADALAVLLSERFAGERGGAALPVRMGLRTGEAHVQAGDYVDHAPINRCARVKGAAHGGQVLATKTTRDLVAGRLGGGFGLKRLGEFRLRDLAEPELIYQLTHADLSARFPPIRTVAERPGNLPLPVSSFIGRERELEQTAAALGQARVVTLTGPGGVGKTRLGLRAAAQVAPRFGGGGWLA